MSTCRSCGEQIIWVVTESGKRMPLDAEPVERPAYFGLFNVDAAGVAHPVNSQPRYVSHFATCPHADEWRRE